VCQRHSTRAHADKHKVIYGAIALDNLMCDPGKTAPYVFPAHHYSFGHQKTSCGWQEVFLR